MPIAGISILHLTWHPPGSSVNWSAFAKYLPVPPLRSPSASSSFSLCSSIPPRFICSQMDGLSATFHQGRNSSIWAAVPIEGATSQELRGGHADGIVIRQPQSVTVRRLKTPEGSVGGAPWELLSSPIANWIEDNYIKRTFSAYWIPPNWVCLMDCIGSISVILRATPRQHVENEDRRRRLLRLIAW